MSLRFTKMHGLGNDFMVIDTINQTIEITPDKIRAWADRHCGIGFDQLMVITKPFDSTSDFGYRIFNADGNEVEQCGNGIRCVAQYIHEKQLSTKTELHIATPKVSTTCFILGNQQVKVAMGQPNFEPQSLPFSTNNIAPYYELAYHDRMLSFGAVSTGNPHVIFEVPDVAQAEVDVFGKFFNQHPAFPRGVNVGFMQILNPHHILLRVYERGAGETLACGTNACAAAVIGKHWSLLTGEITVSLPGGNLEIEQDSDDVIWMTGPAITVFDGVLAKE